MKLADFITIVLDHDSPSGTNTEILNKVIKIEGKKNYRIMNVKSSKTEIIIRIGERK